MPSLTRRADEVRIAAGRERHDQPDRLVGVGGEGGARASEASGAAAAVASKVRRVSMIGVSSCDFGQHSKRVECCANPADATNCSRGAMRPGVSPAFLLRIKLRGQSALAA